VRSRNHCGCLAKIKLGGKLAILSQGSKGYRELKTRKVAKPLWGREKDYKQAYFGGVNHLTPARRETYESSPFMWQNHWEFSGVGKIEGPANLESQDPKLEQLCDRSGKDQRNQKSGFCKETGSKRPITANKPKKAQKRDRGATCLDEGKKTEPEATS